MACSFPGDLPRVEVMILIVLSFPYPFERSWSGWTGGEPYSLNLVEGEFSEGRTRVRKMASWLWWKGFYDPLKASGPKGESHALYDHVPHSHG
jgi:hypothetical protein